MKTFKLLLFSFTFFLITLYSFSCSNTTEPENKDKNFISYQIPGCNHNSALGKVSAIDSCFSYSFNDTLKVNFCVTGNCCPDSDRFTTEYKIKSDTIFVYVTDKAENNCDCMCNYTIHLELYNLEQNRYIFQCNYDNFNYNEIVTK
jgi:hypothetical protein